MKLFYAFLLAGISFSFCPAQSKNGDVNFPLSVNCILEDREATIWLGTQEGVFYYEGGRFKRLPIPGLDDGKTTFLSAALSESDSIVSGKSITCIVQDKAGNIWFASADKGLFWYNHHYFIHFQFNNGKWNRTPGNSLINLAFSDLVNSAYPQPLIETLSEDTDGNICLSVCPNTPSAQPEYIWLNHQPLHFYRFDGIHFSSVKK